MRCIMSWCDHFTLMILTNHSLLVFLFDRKVRGVRCPRGRRGGQAVQDHYEEEEEWQVVREYPNSRQEEVQRRREQKEGQDHRRRWI